MILVLAVELVNSAIDAGRRRRIRCCGRKDLGSAAVMLLLLFTSPWVGVAVSRFVMH